jgi:transposase
MMIELFVARATSKNVEVQSNTPASFFLRLTKLIASNMSAYELDGEIEPDESYFGALRKDNREEVQ